MKSVLIVLPPLLNHYELEYSALINSASTGMPAENSPVSCRINSSDVRYPGELRGRPVSSCLEASLMGVA